MNQKYESPLEKASKFFSQNTSLDFLASRYAKLTRVLYIVSIAAVVVIALNVLINERYVGFDDIVRFLVTVVLGYLFVTYLFGLNAILIEIHQNIKKIANK